MENSEEKVKSDLEHTFLIGTEQTVQVHVYVTLNHPTTQLPEQLMADLDQKLEEVKAAWKKKVMDKLEEELQRELPF